MTGEETGQNLEGIESFFWLFFSNELNLYMGFLFF